MKSNNFITPTLAAIALSTALTHSAALAQSNVQGTIFETTTAANIDCYGRSIGYHSQFSGTAVETTTLANAVIAAVGENATSRAGGIRMDNSQVQGTLIETTTATNVVIAAVGKNGTATVGGVEINDSRVS